MAKETNSIEGLQEPKQNIQDKKYQRNVRGICGDPIKEKIATFYQLKNEKIFKGNNDCEIVLGRDRPSGPCSGYGGLGYSRSSAIDIVVGRTTNDFSKKNSEKLSEGIFLNPDFENDAARIHISQKTDIDQNFEIPDGMYSKGKASSGVGIKADNIRLVARENIRLVAGQRRMDSSGVTIPGGGIELIAINPKDNFEQPSDPPVMQPIPKGTNLERALEECMSLLDILTGLFQEWVKEQSKINQFLASHTHLETFFGNQGIPSIDVQAPMVQYSINTYSNITKKIMDFKLGKLPKFKTKYTESVSPHYINSSYHFLN
jgi:hypothetical protein